MENQKNLTTDNHLRHVDSMLILPSGAGNIPELNAVILGESLASEEHDLIFPSHEFSKQALVPSPQKVYHSNFFYSLSIIMITDPIYIYLFYICVFVYVCIVSSV